MRLHAGIELRSARLTSVLSWVEARSHWAHCPQLASVHCRKLLLHFIVCHYQRKGHRPRASSCHKEQRGGAKQEPCTIWSTVSLVAIYLQGSFGGPPAIVVVPLSASKACSIPALYLLALVALLHGSFIRPQNHALRSRLMLRQGMHFNHPAHISTFKIPNILQ